MGATGRIDSMFMGATLGTLAFNPTWHLSLLDNDHPRTHLDRVTQKTVPIRNGVSDATGWLPRVACVGR